MRARVIPDPAGLPADLAEDARLLRKELAACPPSNQELREVIDYAIVELGKRVVDWKLGKSGGILLRKAARQGHDDDLRKIEIAKLLASDDGRRRLSETFIKAAQRGNRNG